MKVRMKEDKQAAPDGINIIDYQKGRTYDMPEGMAKAFIKQGVVAAVKPVKEEKVEEPNETKVIEPEETKKEDEKPPEEGDKEESKQDPPNGKDKK